MKRVELPLSDLSFEQKLDLMETLWGDIIRDEEKLSPPSWHRTVLKDRNEAFAAGKSAASDWDNVKKRIRKKVSCG